MKKKVLIIEDQILIADNIKRYVSSNEKLEVVGIAISYEEAVELFQNTSPDIALIDIHLNSKKNGIDFAQYLSKQSSPIPFVFLTAQQDSQNLEEAKKTHPSGYLSKPIQKSSLLSTLEISLYNYEQATKIRQFLTFTENGIVHKVFFDEIESLTADHVYTVIVLINGKKILNRTSLKEMLTSLPEDQFVQTHRSNAVNLNLVKNWDSQSIIFPTYTVPISRTYKKKMQGFLNSLAFQNK